MNFEIISNNEIIEITSDPNIIEITSESNVIEIAESVIPVKGDKGEPGESFDSLEFVFSNPSLEWIINHNKGYKPSIIITDVFGNRYEPNMTDVNQNTTIVNFDIPFSGIATIN